MTALDQYIRLEATGRWRESSEEPWQEVVVSFGNASLVLSDFKDRALTHWALAAITTETQENGATRLSPAPDSSEQLEVSDAEMLAAIEKTTERARAEENAPPKRNLVKPFVYLSLIIVFIAGAIYAPAFLKDRAFKMIPPERAVLVGGNLSGSFKSQSCDYPPAKRSLEIIQQHAKVSFAAEPLVIKASSPRFARLPGGQPILSVSLIEEASAPETIAGWLLLAEATPPRNTVLHALIAKKSALEALGFLFSGKIEAQDRVWMAKSLRETRLAPDPLIIENVRAKLAELKIDEAPFLRDLANASPSFEPLRPIEEAAPGTPLLTDQSWVALQSICVDF